MWSFFRPAWGEREQCGRGLALVFQRLVAAITLAAMTRPTAARA